MAKLIDRAAVWFVASAALFCFFLLAFDSIPLAMVLAFAVALCLRRAFSGERAASRRQREAYAKEIIARWRLLPDCLERCAAVYRRAQGLSEQNRGDVRFALARRHSAGREFDASDIMALWPDIMDAREAVIIVTGSVDARAVAFARQLERPRLTLVSEGALAGMMADELSDVPPAKVTLGARARALHTELMARVKPFRCLVSALAFLASYIILGAPGYLPAALALIALALLKARAARAVNHPRARRDG